MTKEELEEQDELIDVKIRTYLENHQLPQQLVDEIAERYLNIPYVRQRIRELFSGFFDDMAPQLKVY